MRRARQVFGLMGGPMLLSALLMTGSAGFRGTSPLNQLSDTINFTGILIIGGGGHFTLNSISCAVQDAGAPTVTPCHLGGAGVINFATGIATSDLSVAGPDGTIAFHQTATRGCALGDGLEVDPAPPFPAPVRIEGVSSTTPLSPQLIFVQGTISVYELGGPPTGTGCTPG